MQLWMDPSSSHDTEPRPSLLPSTPSGETCSPIITCAVDLINAHHLQLKLSHFTLAMVCERHTALSTWQESLQTQQSRRSACKISPRSPEAGAPESREALVACAGPMLSICFTLHKTMKWRNSGWPLFGFFALVGLSAAVCPLMWRLSISVAKRVWRAAHWLSKAFASLMWRLMAIIARVAIALVCLLILAIAAAAAAAFSPAEQAVLRLITSARASTPQTSTSQAAAELTAAQSAAAQQPWLQSRLVRTPSAPAAVQAARALPGSASASLRSRSAQAAASTTDELAPAQPQHTAGQSSALTGPSAGARPPHPLPAPDTTVAPPHSVTAAAPEAAGAQSVTQSSRATEAPGIQAEANSAHTTQDPHTAAAPPSSVRQVPYSGTGATATVRLGDMVSAKPVPCFCPASAIHA